MKGLLPIGSASCGHTVSYHAGRRSASLRFGRKDKICIFVLFRAGTFGYNEGAARKADPVCHEGSFIESVLRGFFMEVPPTMQNGLNTTKKMTAAAACMAIGLLLPFITGHIQVIGQMLSPMHLPIFICGMLCGWKWGAAAGAVTPLLRHFLFQMPPMPGALFMAFELAAYGAVSGLVLSFLMRKDGRKEPSSGTILLSLICAMLCGRVVYGIVRYLFSGFHGTTFTFSMWLTAEFAGTWPGMLLQLILIPLLVRRLWRTLEFY